MLVINFKQTEHLYFYNMIYGKAKKFRNVKKQLSDRGSDRYQHYHLWIEISEPRIIKANIFYLLNI